MDNRNYGSIRIAPVRLDGVPVIIRIPLRKTSGRICPVTDGGLVNAGICGGPVWCGYGDGAW